MPRKKTIDEFEKELKEKSPKIKLLSGNYINSRTKLLFGCDICGHEWETIPNTIMRGHGCPICAVNKTKIKTSKSNQQFLEDLRVIDDTIIPLSVYSNSHSNMEFKCLKCSNQWISKPYVVLQKHGCPLCARKDASQKISLNHKEFLTKANEVIPEIEIIEEYKKSNVKIACKCKSCGYIWKATPNNILRRKTGCIRCNRIYQTSFPEQAIFYYISKIYPDAINGYRDGLENTELDIYIPAIKLGIEYDGVFFHTKETIIKEKRKYIMCKQLGIKLIRIRFDVTPEISDVTILTYKVKQNEEYDELNRVINQLFSEIGGTKPMISIEEDKNDILAIYIKTKKERSLIYNYPEIANEWHPTKNGAIKPNMVSSKSSSKFWWKCLECDYEWEAAISSRTRKKKSGCPKCKHHMFRTNEEFIEELSKISSTIQPLESYTNTSTKILCKCTICNHKWNVAPIKLLNKSGCPKCAINNSRLTIEEVQNKIDRFRDNIKIKKYNGVNYQGEFYCNKCGITFFALSKSVINGRHNCPSCSQKKKIENITLDK